MKRLFQFTCVVVLIFLITTVAFAAKPIRLTVNREEISSDVPIENIKGRIMVPVRWIAEALGATVSWDAERNAVEIDSEILLPAVWNPPLPGEGELSLGYLGPQSKFVLPVVITLNSYLARLQETSLYSGQTDLLQMLVRYEIMDVGQTDNAPWFADDGAYELSARLYYTEIQLEEGNPPSVMRAFIQKRLPNGGLAAGHEELNVQLSWYEDVLFIVRPVGDIAEVERDEIEGQTTLIKGRKGWYVDEKSMLMVRKVELKEMPGLFDLPLPPHGYRYTVLKQR